jgi:hypothetical protein
MFAIRDDRDNLFFSPDEILPFWVDSLEIFRGDSMAITRNHPGAR